MSLRGRRRCDSAYVTISWIARDQQRTAWEAIAPGHNSGVSAAADASQPVPDFVFRARRFRPMHNMLSITDRNMIIGRSMTGRAFACNCLFLSVRSRGKMNTIIARYITHRACTELARIAHSYCENIARMVLCMHSAVKHRRRRSRSAIF